MSAWKKVSAGASILLVIGIFLFIFLAIVLFFAIVAVVCLYVAYRVYRHYRPRTRREFLGIVQREESVKRSPSSSTQIASATQRLVPSQLKGGFLDLLSVSKGFFPRSDGSTRVSIYFDCEGVPRSVNLTGWKYNTPMLTGLNWWFRKNNAKARDEVGITRFDDGAYRLSFLKNQKEIETIPFIRKPLKQLASFVSPQLAVDATAEPSKLYRVIGPAIGHGSVEAWSQTRLPFEPKENWLIDLRNEVRVAVGNLDCGSDQVLHAFHVCASDERGFDIENILFYNVGAGYFARSARCGLYFERVFGQPPPTDEGVSFPHYQHYTPKPKKERGFIAWAVGRKLAEWNAIPCGQVSATNRPESIWYAMKQGAVKLSGRREEEAKPFGLTINILVPFGTSLNLAAVVKPIFDGVIASFHRHSGSDAEVSRRLASSLGAHVNEINVGLHDGEHDILGTRTLLWPRGQGVQWGPADDLCVAGSLVIEQGERWELSGQLFEVSNARETTDHQHEGIMSASPSYNPPDKNRESVPSG